MTPTLSQLILNPWILVPRGAIDETLSLRPGRKIRMDWPNAVQFWNVGTFDWWLIEAELAGWLVDG